MAALRIIGQLPAQRRVVPTTPRSTSLAVLTLGAARRGWTGCEKAPKLISAHCTTIDTPPRFAHVRPAASAARLHSMTRMQRPEIIASLKDLLRQQKQVKIDVDTIGEETRLTQVGFDSISILDFIYDVESRFSVSTEIAELVRMERVKDLIDHLEAKLAV